MTKYLLALICLIGSGCSSFNRDYKSALATRSNASGIDGRIDGPWSGSWQSASGHSGRLRCILANRADRYSARFEAKFWGIFTAHYQVVLHGGERDDATKLSGDADLGGLEGGKYHYEATVTPTNFDATYRAAYDHGEFHMQRPTGSSP